MEILGILVPLVECVSPYIAKRWEYHRNCNKNRDDLREAFNKLNDRKRDIETKLASKVVPNESEAGEQVTSWLKRVENICQECEDIEERVTRDVKFFSRASLGRKFAKKKANVDALYQEGVFNEDDLVNRLPHRGNVMNTTEIIVGETTFQKKRMEIWESLLDDKVTKIGVYGMGGVGKTTALEYINNRLLEETDKFDKVIWVTVSSKSSIRTLQDQIAHKLELDISKINNEETRAQEIRKGFVKSKRHVLILDDLWEVEHDTLKRVGIPDPSHQNGCKLVLSTRSLSVCRKINCDSEIEMVPLSEDEALDLFFKNVGCNFSANLKLRQLAEQVARECARLPLAIVVIAGSLRSKTDLNEWEVALVELKSATTSISSKVMKNLRLSYDWLKDEKYKDCILYCALYPDDYLIERNLLIDQLIGEGMIEDVNTVQYQISKGHVMLNELVRVCLLQDAIDEYGNMCVKMHDLIRDMAIQIMREKDSRFMVRACQELESIPNEESWNEELEKVSLMRNKIAGISSSTKPPKCPGISTLFLGSNSSLKSIPNDFFLHMKGLNVLDLSYTGIIDLPESISDLVTLSVLLLRGCRRLINVPTFERLRNMRRLDFYYTGIKKVPEGLEMLSKLTYLNLSKTRIGFIPDGTLCKLTKLQYFSFLPYRKTTSTLRVEEMKNHRNLETLETIIADVSSLNALLSSFEKGERRIANPRFIVREIAVGSLFVDFLERRRERTVWLIGCDIRCESPASDNTGFPLLLPKSIEVLDIQFCRVHARSLCHLTSLEYTTNLTQIIISRTGVIEHVFHFSPHIFPLLQRVVRLDLHCLWDLRGLVCMETTSSSLPQHPSFSSLKYLSLVYCNKVEKLDLNATSFPSLEELEIIGADGLEQMGNNDDDEGEANAITLPKLRKLDLQNLPKLKSISFMSDFLEGITVRSCPKITKIPLLDREPCPSSLRRVTIDNDVWNSLKWDYPNAKDAIRNSDAWARRR